MDDILCCVENDGDYDALVTELKQHFPLTEQIGDELEFLGTKIKTSDTGTTVAQEDMANRIVEKLQLSDAKPKPAPLPQDARKCTSTSGELLNEEFQTLYRSAVGMIGYLTYTRPDLLYARHFLARYARAPTMEHWRMLNHCGKYIKGTATLGLVFRCGNENQKPRMQVYVDSDHATDKEDRKSVTGIAVFMNGNYVGGDARKQSTPEGSSTGAEIRASALATKRAIGDKNSLDMMTHSPLLPIPIMIDNQATVDLYHSPKLGRKIKYLAVDILMCRSYKDQGLVSYNKVDTKDNISDMMTKALSGTDITRLRDTFMVDTNKHHSS